MYQKGKRIGLEIEKTKNHVKSLEFVQKKGGPF